MGKRTNRRRAGWLSATLVVGSLGAAFGAPPAAAADVTVTIGPAPDYVVSVPNLTVEIGEVVTYQNLGDGTGPSADIHILAHLPAHWVDVVIYAAGSPPQPNREDPSKFVWETGPWALEGKGYPPYGVGVSFPPITQPTTLTLSCLVHGSYDANRVYTSRINQTVTLIPAPVVEPTPDPSSSTEPTPDPSSSTEPTPEPTPSASATGEVEPISTNLTTLPPTDVAVGDRGAGTAPSAIILALMALFVPAILVTVVRPVRPRRRPE